MSIDSKLENGQEITWLTELDIIKGCLFRITCALPVLLLHKITIFDILAFMHLYAHIDYFLDGLLYMKLWPPGYITLNLLT